MRDRAGLRRPRRARRPAARGARLDQHRRRPAARAAADAERDQPALRDARADPPLGRAARRRHRGRLRRARRQGGRARACSAPTGSYDRPAADLALRARPTGRTGSRRRSPPAPTRSSSISRTGSRRARRRRRAQGSQSCCRSGAASPSTSASTPVTPPTWRRSRCCRSAGSSCPRSPGPRTCPRRPHPVNCLIESAAGLEAAYAIASTRGVAGISLGESDLRSETGALEAGLDWARGTDRQRRRRRRPAAAAAVGLPARPRSGRARPLVRPRP